MENLLQVLKEATLFILTAQLFRHLLPGKKYLPYENVILSMAVLSMLIVPILSVADADLPEGFGERVALLETENEMFSQHLEELEEQETGLFRNNMADDTSLHRSYLRYRVHAQLPYSTAVCSFFPERLLFWHTCIPSALPV